ncbi:MAG: HupE/UreJ family protein [Gammaproteobacteria bacterium]
MSLNFRQLLLLCLSTFPTLSFAHAIEGNGFMAGLYHPVFGLDHLLAMLAVGILSTQIGGKAIWTVPASFVTIMLISGWVGMEALVDLSTVQVETGIVFSVILLGFLIALEKNMPILLAMLFVAFFAIFHGYAHGIEVPAKANPFYFAAGFVISTILIHLAGVLIGFIASRWRFSKTLLRYAGAVMMGMGIQMLLG